MLELSLGYPRTLLIALVGKEFGGLETHVLSLYKQLSARGRNPLLLVFANSQLHQKIRKAGLTCYTVPYYKMPGFYRLLNFILTGVLVWLCKRNNIQLIHCNNRFELPASIRVARIFRIKVIFNYHVPAQFDSSILNGVDAFISPAQEIVRYVDEKNRTEKLGIKQIQVISPLFDADKFIRYESNVEPDNWFAINFGIPIKPCPVICTIGNMVPDLQHKNYPLLFEAMATLIHDKKTLVQAVLVGDGPVRPYLETLTRNLDIQDYVHFLGSTYEQIPGVLYHSDVFVLASNKEAFGIVFLEAGLMRKPTIGARNTGAESIIVHEKTGLLFENSSADSLVAGIERLVNDPILAHQYGAKAYDHVMQYFIPSVVVQQYEALYAAL